MSKNVEIRNIYYILYNKQNIQVYTYIKPKINLFPLPKKSSKKEKTENNTIKSSRSIMQKMK